METVEETSPCRKCRSEVSVEAEVCPICGARNPHRSGRARSVTQLIVLIALLLMAGAIITYSIILSNALPW